MTSTHLRHILVFATFATLVAGSPFPRTRADEPRQPDGHGSVTISGELAQWHKVTLTIDGPFAHERDSAPNPFTDYRLTVAFTHESGGPSYNVPGYFAADGDAAASSARLRDEMACASFARQTGQVDVRRQFLAREKRRPVG